MKFFSAMFPGQRLIIIKTNIPTAPPHPIWAQSAKLTEPWIIRVVLYLIALFAPLISHWPPPIWVANEARVIVLAIVVMTLVEVLAQNHIERVLANFFGG